MPTKEEQKEAAGVYNMGEHNFMEKSSEKYVKTIFCTKCGQVAWDYNNSLSHNLELQERITTCVFNTLPTNIKDKQV